MACLSVLLFLFLALLSAPTKSGAAWQLTGHTPEHSVEYLAENEILYALEEGCHLL